MRKITRWFIAAVVLFVGAPMAQGWGVKTQHNIVAAAARLLSKEGSIPLANLEGDVLRGAVQQSTRLSPDMLEAAIEAKVMLLQSVRTRRVDPYFASRLGALGALVAQATSPMASAPASVRARYDADVDGHIERLALQRAARRVVEPRAHLQRLRRYAAQGQDIIVSDYQTGAGFGGVARASLVEDASRSVNAVADIWYTILTGNVIVANLSRGQMRDYALSALAFYIGRGNRNETEASYERLLGIELRTADLHEQIGDMFYAAGQLERAVEEYRRALEKDPTRRAVIERIAAYYLKIAQDALANDALEDARDAYQAAQTADRLEERAAAGLIMVENLIAARDQRLEEARANLDLGQRQETRAERAALREEYAQAIDLLLRAEETYSRLTSEFPGAQQTGIARLAAIDVRVRELKTQLVGSAQRLSGTGFGADTSSVAPADIAELSQAALKHMVEARYDIEVERVRRQYRTELE